MKTLAKYTELFAALLILLWVYTITSKLADFKLFQFQLSGQVFSKSFSKALVYALPLAEAIAVVLLSFKKLRLVGFLYSAALMGLFTGYIILILTGYFPKTPCACGGVLANLGWHSHLYFNLCWTVLAITGASIEYKQRMPKERSLKIH